jgi:hypothetical protein
LAYLSNAFLDTATDVCDAMVYVLSVVKLDLFSGLRPCHVKRDLLIRQKRPTYKAKETYL